MRQIKQNTSCWIEWNSTWRSFSFQAWIPGNSMSAWGAHLVLAVVVDNETGETRVVDATSVVFGDKPT